MLKDHIITKIEEYNVRTRYPRFIGKNSKLPAHRYGVELSVIEITTDKGAMGFGLGRCDRILKQNLLGRPLSEVFDPAIGILEPSLQWADIALHDLAGKILGISVKKMISDAPLDKISCYDGAIYLDDISPDRAPAGLDGLIQHCRDDMALGYTDFKLKMGRKTWMGKEEGMQRDVDVVRLVRQNFPDARILVDPNDAYTLDEAIWFMEHVKDCGIYWVEEPFCENREDLLKFKAYLKENSPETLIADGEWAPDYIHTRTTLELVDSLAEEKLIDAVLMDTVDYGFTNWRKYLTALRDKKGTKWLSSPHNWNSSFKTKYCSHLAAAFPDLIPTIEGVVDTLEGVESEGYKMENGLLTVPDEPGFGMQLIWGRKIG